MPTWLVEMCCGSSGGLCIRILTSRKSALCSFTQWRDAQATEQIQMIPAEASTSAILSMHPISQCELFKNTVPFSSAMSYKLGYKALLS